MAAPRKKKATSSRTRRAAPPPPPPPEETENDEEEEEEEDDGEEEEEDGGGGEEEDGGGGEEEEEEENNDPARPTLTAKEKGKLFQAYQEATDTVAEVEQAMLVAKVEQSETVKNIYDNVGPGPFLWKGKQIKVVARKGKYFMRTESAAAEEIEA